MKKVSLDIGNGYCVLHDGKNTYALRSLFHPLANSEQPESGDTVVCIGTARYVLGDNATFYRNCTALAEGNKAEMALPFALALLRQTGEFDVVVSVPDKGRYSDMITTALNGVHSWSDGSKNEYTTTINVTRTVLEGFGSFLQAQKAGKLPTQGVTVVVDIGAGTFCALAIDNKTGRILEQMAVEQTGVVRLCNDIRSDIELKRSVGDELRLRYLFDGIIDGSFQYGSTGVSFHDSLQEHMKPWLQSIVRQVKSQFSPHMPSVKKFLFTGGGTLLVRDRINNPMFLYAESPLVDNAVGGFYA